MLKMKEEALKIKEEIIKIRRLIHANPELGFEEWQTSKLVSAYLNSLGLEVQEGIAKTGVVGFLEGNNRNKVLAIRADMDALPIQEQNKFEYKSKNKGKMHACGHDAHTAMVLGVAKLLSKFKAELEGSVKFIFQPNEEQSKIPGGADTMIEEGVLENPRVEAILGIHVNPQIEVGSVGIKEGSIMAATDKFKIIVKGEGGHGAAPHETIDAIIIAADIVQNLQAIVSRRISPVEPVVLTIGKVCGGESYNVIADEIQIEGTVRTVNPEIREQIPMLMEQTIDGVTDIFGGDYRFDYQFGHSVLNNNRELTNLVTEVSKIIIGEEKSIILKNPLMAGEDFASYTKEVPGFFLHLGVKNSERKIYPWHHSKFNLDEEALPIGTAILAQSAIEYFKNV
ncbi:M20 metallopeptidase family protein [Orenia marismortui]|uniref:Amidohydrolase n=1 Tax=Orenia marismortui TaxID=46469 RepID=A0A4R8H356_9FIRM|nr:M20 family metallopeptidase [Orenia marismortui]TDX48897.1 amidohydrolase [Orenia marismortui]